MKLPLWESTINQKQYRLNYFSNETNYTMIFLLFWGEGTF